MANSKQYDIVLKNGRVIDPEIYFDRVCNAIALIFLLKGGAVVTADSIRSSQKKISM